MNERESIINDLIKIDKGSGKISTKNISDTYHTFGELYHHRAILFSIICNQNKSLAWKSWLHDDGTMFDEMFIVGISTPEGDYSYHYNPEYWHIFNVKELPMAPKFDGHKPSDIGRLNSLVSDNLWN
jgi:hypothetical protein